MQLPYDQWGSHKSGARKDRAMRLNCDRIGNQWRIGLGTRSALVRHCLGMSYLATPIANPGQEITAAELTMGPGSSADIRAKVPSSNQSILDMEAVQQYRQCLAALQKEIEHRDVVGDQEHAIRAHAERDWLLAELRAATGWAGRGRAFASTNERARIAVGKAIRRALERISSVDPVIGADLASHVSTGQRCCYRPHP